MVPNGDDETTWATTQRFGRTRGMVLRCDIRCDVMFILDLAEQRLSENTAGAQPWVSNQQGLLLVAGDTYRYGMICSYPIGSWLYYLLLGKLFLVI